MNGGGSGVTFIPERSQIFIPKYQLLSSGISVLQIYVQIADFWSYLNSINFFFENDC